MVHHDPKKFLEGLRDHLSRHDYPLAFLFGAGTSSAVNIAPAPPPGSKPTHTALIPAIGELTKRCREAVVAQGAKYEAAWDAIAAELVVRGRDQNIENVLTRLQLKIDGLGGADKALGLDANHLRAMETIIRSTIVTAVSPTSFPAELPHDHLSLWLQRANRKLPVEIFTTNYDLLFERSFEALGVPAFDGFVGCQDPFFHAASLHDVEHAPGAAWIRLWKVHGSVNWSVVDSGGGRRIVRRNALAPVSGELIFPSHLKYDRSRKLPYVALLDRLTTVLQHGAMLVVSGYGFGDDHINAALFDGLARQPKAHVIALQYGRLSDYATLVDRAARVRNLVVAASDGAVIGGCSAGWRLTEAVTDGLAEAIDPAFDSDAAPEATDSGLSGLMRIGDFNRLCSFLSTLVVGAGFRP